MEDVYAGRFDRISHLKVVTKDSMDYFRKKSNLTIEQSVNQKEYTHSFPSQIPKTKQRKIGRNDPCPCGSGKKYKKCCM